MRRFYFHLKGPDATERDQIGVACPDVERAYLEACRALPDLAAEILRARKDPMRFAFEIENEDRVLLLTVPFCELLSARQRPPVRPIGDRARDAEEYRRKRLREGDARIRRQREIVAMLHARELDTTLARQTLDAFEKTHSLMSARFDEQQAVRIPGRA